MAIVETKNIKKTYRQGKVNVPALCGVDLIVDKGEFVALAGPSGSGKTTLLNIIGGLDLPDSGSVMVDNNKFADMNQADLASLRLHKIGFVFQAFNLIPVLSAIENVEYVMLLQGVPKTERHDRAKAILDDVGLEGKLPPVWYEFTLKTDLLERVVGSEMDLKVDSIKKNEVLMLNVNAAATVGIVQEISKNKIACKLRLPVCAAIGAKVTISRRVGTRFRLIGFGEILEK